MSNINIGEKNSKIKMLALDLDGTTLRTDKSLSERNADALKAADEMGVRVVVSTGRPYTALPKNVLSLGILEYVINSNGAVITDLRSKKTVYEKCLPPEKVDAILDAIRPTGRKIELFTGGHAFADRTMYDEVKNGGCDYRNPAYFLASRKPVDDIFSFTEAHRDRVENISIFFDEVNDKPSLYDRLSSIPDIVITSSIANNFEIGAKGVSKANALKFLMEKYKINQDELMAVGDNINDLAMVKFAGVGVAMENGDPELKKNADYVTLSNDKDGVAKAVSKFILKR